MTLTLQPVRLAAIECGEGMLVFSKGALIAVLVRLSHHHEELAGAWFLEVGLGPLDGPTKPIFNDMDAAQEWIAAQLA
jgi:hypothetical protein